MHGAKSTLLQDLSFRKPSEIKSSASEVSCYICGRMLQDGCCITAKTLPNGTALFCDTHYSLQ